MLLAQLTDTHVIDDQHQGELYVDNNKRLTQAVDRLNSENVSPDAVLGSGDLTDSGSPSEMSVLKELLAPLRARFLPVAGNHDRRDTFAELFDMPWILGLDTMVNQPNRPELALDDIDHGGLFDDERADWLAAELEAAGDHPVVIAMHHPPFVTGINFMDEAGLTGRERFSDVVARSGANVIRILCGHLHRPITTSVAGVVTSTGISTVHQVELNLAPDAAVQVSVDPPGYHLHQIEPIGDGPRPQYGCVTHVRHFDTGHQPIDPSWA